MTAVRDELDHALLEHGQRNRAERLDRIVELALVELRPELLFRLAAMPANLQLPELVGQRLSGPGNVALPSRWMPVSITSLHARHIS